ncbi:hypothetical protein [Saliphagus infecundisoli]|uniref:hypothetical protein n=1 Tax=Saliphagus infecundisoli TaxID=1849069 RepID=UPI001CD7514E|nr:hypothetical protein [Saliphagus infecundisoli]
MSRATDSGVSDGVRGLSWLSYTNSTNREIVEEKPSRGLRLTDREEITLREDVRDWWCREGDRAVTWAEGQRKFLEYDREARRTENVFENTLTGTRASSAVSHRFQPEYRERWYAKFHDLLRAAQERWAVVHTTMLGLTGSSTPDGDRMCPVDHWRDCDASNDAVKEAIRRLKDELGDAVAIEFVEAHPGGGTNDGYLHKHPVIVSGQRVPDGLLQKVLNAHVNNSPNAEHDAHRLSEAVTRSRVSGRKDSEEATEEVIGNLPAYLAGYLLNYGESLEELPESQVAGAVVMWATGTQSVRPGGRASEWMRFEGEEDEEESLWVLAGVERDGEFIPASDGGSGVSTFTTSRGLDPPECP